jgi:hypothetical protein
MLRPDSELRPVEQLPMPSDVKRATAPSTSPASPQQNLADPPIEPPSVKLIVRLFLIPLVIVSLAVGVMFLIGRLAGSGPSFDEAIARLKNTSGGERTADWLIGPGAKQRYLDAKTLTDKMKSGMSVDERIKLADQLIDLLDNHVRNDEGEVQHFVLLALGRVWQLEPRRSDESADAFEARRVGTASAAESRQRVAQTLLRYAGAEQLATRKAAVLATAYLAGRPEADALKPMLIEKLRDDHEDVDVRIAAATALGPLSTPDDKAVIDALETATRDTKPEDAELVWSSSLSLAELNQPDVAPTILKLLDRNELSKLQYFDRETDPKNPSFRTLNDQEQQRILINTMLGAQKLQVPEVQAKLSELTEKDPSPRVRAAGVQILDSNRKHPTVDEPNR